MQKRQIGLAYLLTILLIIPIALMQCSVDRFRGKVGLLGTSGKLLESNSALPSNMIGAALAGFREPVAGLLWVKADDYFHQGKFAEMVPLMKVITLIDPHMIDVYSTGAWHLDYNFVDKNEHSDRRLIPNAIQFLEEGVKNNPRVFDLYFELGFTHYMMKARDASHAIYWFKRADGKKTTDDQPTPRYVYHSLAHAYEMNGQIDECLKTWQRCIDYSTAEVNRLRKSGEIPSNITKNTTLSNEATLAMWDLQVSKSNYDRVLTRKLLRADLPSNRTNVNLEFTIKRIKPGVLLVSGVANVPDNTKVDVLLRDADWQERAKRSFTWRIDNQTIFLDSAMVRSGKFQAKVDVTDDSFYPMKDSQYELSAEINPRLEPEESQDKLGWSGEGLNDSHYLDTSTPGLRKARKVVMLPLSAIK